MTGTPTGAPKNSADLASVALSIMTSLLNGSTAAKKDASPSPDYAALATNIMEGLTRVHAGLGPQVPRPTTVSPSPDAVRPSMMFVARAA